MQTIDDLVSDVMSDVYNRHNETPVEVNSNTPDTHNDFVDDVLGDMFGEDTDQVETTSQQSEGPSAEVLRQVAEAFASEEDNEDDGLDHANYIECPDCGMYAYWREDTESYYCPNCGWEGDNDEEEEEYFDNDSEEEVIPELPEVITPSEAESVIELASPLNELEEAISDSIEASVPQNSASLLVDDTTSRFSGAPWYEIVQDKIIILAGLGGIGSYVNLFLARMKPKAMYLYDDDIVESANMSGQFYGSDSFGKTKVKASIEIVRKFADYYDSFGDRRRFTNESDASDIMICGFDNMKARKTFFIKWLEHVEALSKENRSQCLYVDGRLAAESMQVFCITGNDEESIQKYKQEWLFDDSEADATVCSYKQTTYCAAMIGSIITNLFVNFCTNLGEPIFDREVPFLTTYDAELMQFKTEY